MSEPTIGTFSIIAISSKPKRMGIAVASGTKSVGDRVPHAKPGIGVIATQAYTNVAYGISGMKLMSNGLSPKETLSRLLQEDHDRELRQVAIMDFKRRKATFTGKKVPESHAKLVRQEYVAIGNMLVRKDVVRSMAEEFKLSRGDLSWRMTRALKAGSESGGDRRGEKSAALIIISEKEVQIRLAVDSHETPIEELFHKL
ncbi:MAG: DUF1028 domain-containing protein [Candidatus Bathyarchaeota archaeon]|nr:MAG: DUF1028 domain-containing protein [Candidatus Bathyarchaeota archaeon]